MRLLSIALLLITAGFVSQAEEQENEADLLLGSKSSLFIEHHGKPDQQEKRFLGIGNRYTWGNPEGNFVRITDQLSGLVDSITIGELRKVDDLSSVNFSDLRIEALVRIDKYCRLRDWELIAQKDRGFDSIWVSQSTGNRIEIILTEDLNTKSVGYFATVSKPTRASRRLIAPVLPFHDFHLDLEAMKPINIAQEFEVSGRLASIRPQGDGNVNDTYLAVFRTHFSEERIIIQRVNGNVLRSRNGSWRT